MIRFLLPILVILVTGVVGQIARADDIAPPVKLSFSSYDSMTVRDCLRVMSMETGDIILPDASVNGFVGAINVSKQDVPTMLDYLKTYEPGLTYQIVYYPSYGNEPDGEELYQDIQAVKAFTIEGVLIPPAGEDNTMFTFTANQYTQPDAEKKAETGMREIYLVSDPTVRAQMKKDTASPPAQTTTAKLPEGITMTAFGNNLNMLVQQIAKMNPAQQTLAMLDLAKAQKQINQSLDPSVLTNLQNGYIPRQPGALRP